jgi:hypothetical protein
VWRQLLVDLADAAFRAELAANAERAVWDQHERFVKCALDLAA